VEMLKLPINDTIGIWTPKEKEKEQECGAALMSMRDVKLYKKE
jgi:hypothetical protein